MEKVKSCVRLQQDKLPFLQLVIVLTTVFILFMALPIAVIGMRLFFILAVPLVIIIIITAIEKKYPRNRIHLFLYTPFSFIGIFLYISAISTMYVGDRMHGIWLISTIFGALHILIFNILIWHFLNADAAIEFMKKSGRINVANGKFYFNMPDFADRRIGLPEGLITALWMSRGLFIAACLFGAIVFGPGLYSSVGAYERLLNGAGTIQLGMGVLMARLWHFPLALAIQRKFEQLPADEKYLKVE